MAHQHGYRNAEVVDDTAGGMRQPSSGSKPKGMSTHGTDQCQYKQVIPVRIGQVEIGSGGKKAEEQEPKAVLAKGSRIRQGVGISLVQYRQHGEEKTAAQTNEQPQGNAVAQAKFRNDEQVAPRCHQHGEPLHPAGFFALENPAKQDEVNAKAGESQNADGRCADFNRVEVTDPMDAKNQAQEHQCFPFLLFQHFQLFGSNE